MAAAGARIKAGVMGWPIDHSLSPLVHGYWLERLAIDGAYVPLAVPPDDLEAELRALAGRGFAGVNLTVPHKQTALAVMDRIDPVAARLGAVNTVVVEDDGTLSGSNTDGFGFLENLRDVLPGWTPEGREAAILGAGGAARAVVAALADAGAGGLRLINRTRARAETVAEDLGGPVAVMSWDERAAALDGVSLLVNTTILGMAGQAALEIDISALPVGTVVYDIVYRPRMTPLLTAAAAAGHRIVTGIGMLLHQARPGFEAWFGAPAAVDDGLRDLVQEALDASSKK